MDMFKHILLVSIMPDILRITPKSRAKFARSAGCP